MASEPLQSQFVDGPSFPYFNSSPNNFTPETLNNSSTQDGLEPVAIVGLSLRFPQEATSPEAFWSMLLGKRCAMTGWPSDRLNPDAFYHPDPNRNDTVKYYVLIFKSAHLLHQKTKMVHSYSLQCEVPTS